MTTESQDHLAQPASPVNQDQLVLKGVMEFQDPQDQKEGKERRVLQDLLAFLECREKMENM